MFLINQEDKLIYHVDRSLIKIDGSFDVLKKTIEEKIQIFSINENYFVNTMLCNKEFNPNKNTIIIDSYRNKEFFLFANVVNDYGGINNILNLYFSFKNDEEIKLHKVLAFGKRIPPFKLVQIDNINKLLKNSFIIETKLSNKLFHTYCYFPYSLGTYKKNKYFIGNVWKGVSKSKKLSINKAVSESVERLSASIYDYTSCESNNNLTCLVEPFINNNDFIRHKDYIIYDKIKSISGMNNKNCPLDILYYPYKYTFPCISNSNGMATHKSYKLAVYSALLEIIERDSFILMRLLKNGIYKINIKKLKFDYYKSITEFKKKGLKFYTFIIKLDNPIPVSVIIVEKGCKNIVVSGIGNTIEEAVEKTFEEAVGNIPFFYEKIRNNNDIIKHIDYYLQEENSRKIDRLKKLDAIDYKKHNIKFLNKLNVTDIIKYYKKLGINFFVYKYKNNINRAFRRYTVRVLSDTLLPIYFGKEIPSQILNSNRLAKFKKQFNVKNINTDLHPMG